MTSEERKLYNKEYYEKNKQKIDETSKEFIKNNREHYNKYQREYYHRNRNKLNEYQKRLYKKKKYPHLFQNTEIKENNNI
jgi:hypothetical protein